MLIKEAGICVRCLGEWQDGKHALCRGCKTYWRTHYREHNPGQKLMAPAVRQAMKELKRGRYTVQ